MSNQHAPACPAFRYPGLNDCTCGSLRTRPKSSWELRAEKAEAELADCRSMRLAHYAQDRRLGIEADERGYYRNMRAEHLLAACKGLLGLVQLVDSRDDMPIVLAENHRYQDALALVERLEGKVDGVQ